MLKRAPHSIVFRITILMASIITLGVFSMFSSVYISEQADSDAEAINLSGSMRMQALRIYSEIALYQQSPTAQQQLVIQRQIQRFDNKINQPVLQVGFGQSDMAKVEQTYQEVIEQWQGTVRPALIKAASEPVDLARKLQFVNAFVDSIDLMVVEYQKDAESNIEQLRMVQIGAIIVTLVLVYICLHFVHHSIASPLKKLTDAARYIAKGDFTHRVHLSQNDELGILADTINTSSETVSRMYGDLEKRVAIKTRKLKQSNDALSLLFDTARQINESSDADIDFDPLIKKLAQVSGLSNLDLCLVTPQGDVPFVHYVNDEDKALPTKCLSGDCGSCRVTQVVVQHENDAEKVKFPILKDETYYGVLVCTLAPETLLEDWQRQLLHSLTDQIGVALSLKSQVDQERRMALMNERTVIARELHDSLAQSLSYLKIQVTRLQKALPQQDKNEKVDAVVLELKTGLNSAYRQLRELLTTFRLKINGPGLESTITDSVESLRERTGMLIDLDYQLDNIPLTPNEEIHLLQITREALQNALHHSRGIHVTVSLTTDNEKRVHLQVDDDGVGIPVDPQKLNHYGLAIMQERSHSLQGVIRIARKEDKGTRVAFSFMPEYARARVA